MKTLIEALADAVENNGNINAKVLKAIKSVIAAFDALPAPVVPEGFVQVKKEDLLLVLKLSSKFDPSECDQEVNVCHCDYNIAVDRLIESLKGKGE